MTTPTETNRDLLTVVATLRARPGKEAELRTALESLVAPTRAEQGNVNYDLHQGVEDPAVFVFYENWESPELLARHLASPELQQAIAAAARDLLDGEISIVPLRRIA
jgi:quinol monooxygenase YgiN